MVTREEIIRVRRGQMNRTMSAGVCISRSRTIFRPDTRASHHEGARCRIPFAALRGVTCPFLRHSPRPITNLQPSASALCRDTATRFTESVACWTPPVPSVAGVRSIRHDSFEADRLHRAANPLRRPIRTTVPRRLRPGRRRPGQYSRCAVRTRPVRRVGRPETA